MEPEVGEKATLGSLGEVRAAAEARLLELEPHAPPCFTVKRGVRGWEEGMSSVCSRLGVLFVFLFLFFFKDLFIYYM